MKIIIFFVQRKAQWYKVFSISVRVISTCVVKKKQFYAPNYFIELYIKHVFMCSFYWKFVVTIDTINKVSAWLDKRLYKIIMWTKT